MDYAAEYDACRAMVDEALEDFFVEACAQGELLEAMRYSLLAGGKRIRPVLVLKFCEAAGGQPETALPAACAVEMLHTYSLIHDDLPCMDDDALRRGKPTCHTVYGEANAMLAGDALQASAFRTLLTGGTPAETTVAMACALAEAAGERGMCGGQYLDLADTLAEPDEGDLRRLNALKTGALLAAACRMGALCGGASPAQLAAAEEYAQNLGMAFQIRDDVLDVTATAAELGKTVGSDAANGKTTFATLLSTEACDRLVASYTADACAAVSGAFPRDGFLLWLARDLAGRRK